MPDQSPVYTMLSAPGLPNSSLCPIVRANSPEQVLVQIAPTDLAQCSHFAPYGYVPMQAVASGVVTPDATIEVVDPSGNAPPDTQGLLCAVDSYAVRHHPVALGASLV